MHKAEKKHESAASGVEKAERLVQNFTKLSASVGSPNPSGSGDSTPGVVRLDEDAVRAVMAADATIDGLRVERDELNARMSCLQDGWDELDRFLFEKAAEIAEARARFSQLMSKRGGDLVVVGPGSIAPSTQHMSTRDSRATRPSPHLSVRTSVPPSRSNMPLSASQYATSQPASRQVSRVRPRAGSMDGSYQQLTGPGGPPPSKRMRSDRDYDRDLQVPAGRPYSPSVSVLRR